MRRLLTLSILLAVVFALVGCSNDIAITEGHLIKESNKTTVNISVAVTSNLFTHFELYPSINSTLLDNLGNEYHVLDVTPGSNFDGVIRQSGTYSGGLIFPKLKADADYLRLRIDNVRFYNDNKLLQRLVITFNFRAENITENYTKTSKKVSNKELTGNIRTNDKTYSLDSVTVSKENGDILKEFKINR